MIKIVLEGVPVAKGRPRFSRKGFAYTPAKTRSYEAALQVVAKAAMQGKEPLEGPLLATFLICMPIPKSYSKKKAQQARTQQIRPTKKPDIDNYVKCIDALNGVVFKDDNQIVDMIAGKYYSDAPRTVIEIKEI